MSDDKRCRICGDGLERTDMGDGCVWSCATHGVRDWVFGFDGQAPGSPSSALSRAPRGPRLP